MAVRPPHNAHSDLFGSLLQQYRCTDGSFDEAVASEGVVREGWQTLFANLGQLSVGEIERRIAKAQRQMDLDGVAFNPHDSTGGVSRPWSLDPIPLILRQSEWKSVAAGLEQRARLADLILLDLLGPQTLLQEKVLPPESLFAHPKYFPAYHSLVPYPKQHLQLYAADLARSPDGGWWVTADRTRNPFGLGYILENRLITSRMLPSVFGACNVERLASFFMTLRNSMKERAHQFRENPRIAIWSKGPASRSYFEDAFLARYLGYTLVEGEDLAVRNNRVMLKTLGGLLPVEVLWRRVEDDQCDATELAGANSSSVSGLLEIVRASNVSVCNSIGSVLAESPMLFSYLPSVCKHLLGEELLLPSIATWWCGRPKALTYVLEHLDKLIIRKAFREDDAAPVRPATLTAEEKSELVEKIKQQPARYVGQEQVERSTTPVWHTNQLQSWSLAIRAFAVADEGSYEVLPGALARVSPNPELLSHNMTSGEKSQDVWIVAEKPVPAVSLLPFAGSTLDLRRGGAELPSRVADNLFWLGRNLERAEQLARLIRITLQKLSSEDMSAAGILGLVDACRKVKQISDDVQNSADYAGLASEITRTATDASVSQSLRSVVNLSYSTAAKVRDRIALDSFRVVTELRELFERRFSDYESAPTDFISVLDDAITELNALSGLASESMTRTQGWRFLDLGRRLERTYQTARLIRSLLPMQTQDLDMTAALENCLQICDSFMTYRSRYLADIQPEAVLDLLIADDSNPRSIIYQLQTIQEHVDLLPRSETQATMSTEQRLATAEYSEVRLADVFELCTADSHGELSTLHTMLIRLMTQLPRLSDAISSRFLIHAGLQRHFATLQRPADDLYPLSGHDHG